MEGPFLSKLLTMSPVQIDDKAILFQVIPLENMPFPKTQNHVPGLFWHNASGFQLD